MMHPETPGYVHGPIFPHNWLRYLACHWLMQHVIHAQLYMSNKSSPGSDARARDDTNIVCPTGRQRRTITLADDGNNAGYESMVRGEGGMRGQYGLSNSCTPLALFAMAVPLYPAYEDANVRSLQATGL